MGAPLANARRIISGLTRPLHIVRHTFGHFRSDVARYSHFATRQRCDALKDFLGDASHVATSIEGTAIGTFILTLFSTRQN